MAMISVVNIRFLVGATVLMLFLLCVAPSLATNVSGLINRATMLGDLGRFSEAELYLKQAVESAPDNYEVHYWLGCAQLSLNKKSEALTSFNHALRLKPLHADSMVLKASLIENFDEAQQLARRAVELEPDNQQVTRMAGKVMYQAGNLVEAIELFEKAIKADPRDLNLANDYGCALADSGRLQQAIEVFENALDKAPFSFTTRLNLALAFKESGRADEAVLQFREALNLEPDNIDVRMDFAKFLLNQNQAEQAKKQWNILKLTGNHEPASQLAELIAEPLEAVQPPSFPILPNLSESRINELTSMQPASSADPELEYLKGHAWLHRGRAFESYQSFRRAVGLEPTSAELRYGLGLGAERMAREQTPAFGAHPEARHVAMYDEAEDAYEKALMLNPELIEAHFAIARIYGETRRRGSAFTRLGKLLQQNPETPMVRYHIAMLLLRQNFQPMMLTPMVEPFVSSTNPFIALELAYPFGVQQTTATYEEVAKLRAAEFLEKEVEISPQKTSVHRALGVLRAENQEFDKAISSFKQAAADKQDGLSLWEVIRRRFPDWQNRLQAKGKEYFQQLVKLAAECGDQEAITIISIDKLESLDSQPAKELFDQLQKSADSRDPQVRLMALAQLGKMAQSRQEIMHVIEKCMQADFSRRSEHIARAAHIAADMLQKYLDNNFDPNLPGSEGRLPLEAALHYDNPGLTARLLKQGADVNVLNKDKRPLLHLSRSVETLQILLDSNPDIEITDSLGKTKLHAILDSRRDSAKMFTMMLDAGANLNAQTQLRVTPLIFAVKTGQLNIVKLLVERGADFNTTDEFGAGLLHVAMSNSPNSGIAEFFIENGYDVNQLTLKEYRPIHSALNPRVPASLFNLLVEKGADLRVLDSSKSNLLHLFSGHNLEHAAKMLQAGCDINARDRYGRTPLHRAVENRNISYVEFLMANGADPSVKDNQGKTAYDRASAISATPQKILRMIKPEY